ncbi:MAG: hypothetical protein HXY48_09840 [Ignavibacteriaceae bacterium]|nr:hypothetical protein [Ignavibacteriaceae bacterium]
MHYFELKAKVKPGKENELNQVLNDLIPQFQSIADIKTKVHFNEADGALDFRISNGGYKKIKEIMENKNFVLFIGSVKVLCDEYTILFPNDKK